MRDSLSLLLGVCFLASPLAAQNCSAPPMPPFSPSTMLTVEQEGYLGDALARSMNEDLKVIEDDTLSAPLQRIGDKLRSYVPPDSPHFQFFIVDMPITNAFTIAGGRVYVTRKAIALARNEDEIAGLLAHEMGHVLTRQTATEYRQLFRQVLKVDSLGGRDDIEERYNELLDRAATNRKAWESLFKNQEKDQLSADQMSVYLATRAGYSPEKFADYFDRLAQNRGKKGNWFTDVFGNTTADSKRYREMLKNGAENSITCAGKADRMTDGEFAKWKDAVTYYHGFGKKQALPPDARRQVMQEPLREEIQHLRFSPDGKYLVAQDNSSIYVLSRDPFKTLFRIDAENAHGAQFTPDSKSVVFYTFSNRIEKWDIAEQQQSQVDEVYTASPCVESRLSPWGDRLACLHANKDHYYALDLDIYNAESGDVDWRQKDIFEVDWLGYFLVSRAMQSSRMLDLIPLAFSPDGRYLVGSSRSFPFAYDFTAKKPFSSLQLAGIRDFIAKDFVFIGQEVIFGAAGQSGEKSSAVQFPSGRIVESDVPVGPFTLYPPAKGSYLILRPVPHAAAGILDMKTKKIFMINKTPAVDIYDDTIVSERTNGEIALYSKDSNTPVATTQLPLGPLSRFDAVAISPNLNYVAYSGQIRGAVWSLQTGSRLDYFRGFRGAYFDNQGKMNAIFPPADSYNPQGAITKQEAKEKAKQEGTADDLKKEGMTTALLDIGTNSITPVTKLERRFQAIQVGPYLILSAFRTEGGDIIKDREMEVREISTGKQLWTRKFKSNEFPLQYFNLAGNALAHVWSLDSDEAKQLLKSDANLTARVESLGRKGIILVEVDDLATGQMRFVTPIDTGDGSLAIRDVNAVGNTLLITDNHGRLLIYEPSGKVRARTFATQPTINPEQQILAARVEPGRLALYDLDSLHPLATLTFSSPVVYKQFSGDGKNLAVITSDQTIYTIPVDHIPAKK